MSKVRALVSRCVVMVAFLGVVLPAPSASALDLDPLARRMQVVASQIYDLTEWALRVPYDLAYPVILRAGLTEYIKGLDLEPAAEARILDRVRADDFVDDVVPFLLAMKDSYVPSDAARRNNFDAHLRRSYRANEAIAGMEHSMFRWAEEEAETKAADDSEHPSGDAGGVDQAAADFNLAFHLVGLYDALYLSEAPTVKDRSRETSLACEDGVRGPALARRVGRAKPTVRVLLEALLDHIGPSGDIGEGVHSILVDETRLTTVTVTLVQFVDLLVCKHYRAFATRLVRAQQLERWMLAELDRPGGGNLWHFLHYADHSRRHGVLVAVDGLEGRLVEALAKENGNQVFLRELVREHREGSTGPRFPTAVAAPEQSVEFLPEFARRGGHDPRYLPFFRDLFHDSGESSAKERPSSDPLRPWGVVEVGVATTPTISVRNLPVIKTGAPVAGEGSTGIPNFHFVDRTLDASGKPHGRAYYFFGNDALQLERLADESGMRSLFERLPEIGSFNCAAQFDRGAHFTIDALINLALGETVRDFAEMACMTELEERGRNERTLSTLRKELLAKRDVLLSEPAWHELVRRRERRDEKILAKRLIARIATLEQRAMPELLVYYNPWPDHFAHFKGPFSDEILAPSGELNRLDFWLGRVDQIYRDAGVHTRTVFAMAGDHGLTPVYQLVQPEDDVFARLAGQGVDFHLTKISSDEGEGPKLTDPFDPPSMGATDVVVASTAGGNYMLDLFKSHAAPRWTEQPLYNDLLAIGPDSFGDRPRKDPSTIDLIETLATNLGESLDYLAVRETPCSVDGAVVRLVRRHRGKRTDAWIERRGDRVFYRFKGTDLLGLREFSPYETPNLRKVARHKGLLRTCVDGARAEDPATWCDEAQWMRLTSYTGRPDSVVQLAHLYDLDRAGTINLFPVAGVAYNSLVPGRHAGEHFHEKNAFVGVWGSPVTRGALAGRIRTGLGGAAPMAIYEYLSGRRAVKGQDGWGYPSLAAALFD